MPDLQPYPMWMIPRRIGLDANGLPAGITGGPVPLPNNTQTTAPQHPGPAWLQKFNQGFGKFADKLSGYTPSPYLDPAENAAIQQRQKMAAFAQLAASSGPAPVGTRGVLQPFGEAMGAGMQAGDAGIDQAMKARALASQMARYNAKQGPQIGTPDPKDFTTASLSDYLKTGDPSALVLREKPAAAPELSDAGKKVRDLRATLGRDPTEQEILAIMGAGAETKVDPLDKVLSPAEALALNVPYGTTSRQAAGATPISDSQRTRQEAKEGAINAVSKLRQMALGTPAVGDQPATPGVFTGNGGSWLTDMAPSRAALGSLNALGNFRGTPASKRRTAYTRFAEGATGLIAKAMGNVGSLSDEDRASAMALLSKLGAMPDTEEQARQMFDTLEAFLTSDDKAPADGGWSIERAD